MIHSDTAFWLILTAESTTTTLCTICKPLSEVLGSPLLDCEDIQTYLFDTTLSPSTYDPCRCRLFWSESEASFRNPFMPDDDLGLPEQRYVAKRADGGRKRDQLTTLGLLRPVNEDATSGNSSTHALPSADESADAPADGRDAPASSTDAGAAGAAVAALGSPGSTGKAAPASSADEQFLRELRAAAAEVASRASVAGNWHIPISGEEAAAEAEHAWANPFGLPDPQLRSNLFEPTWSVEAVAPSFLGNAIPTFPATPKDRSGPQKPTAAMPKWTPNNPFGGGSRTKRHGSVRSTASAQRWWRLAAPAWESKPLHAACARCLAVCLADATLAQALLERPQGVLSALVGGTASRIGELGVGALALSCASEACLCVSDAILHGVEAAARFVATGSDDAAGAATMGALARALGISAAGGAATALRGALLSMRDEDSADASEAGCGREAAFALELLTSMEEKANDALLQDWSTSHADPIFQACSDEGRTGSEHDDADGYRGGGEAEAKQSEDSEAEAGVRREADAETGSRERGTELTLAAGGGWLDRAASRLSGRLDLMAAVCAHDADVPPGTSGIGSLSALWAPSMLHQAGRTGEGAARVPGTQEVRLTGSDLHMLRKHCDGLRTAARTISSARTADCAQRTSQGPAMPPAGFGKETRMELAGVNHFLPQRSTAPVEFGGVLVPAGVPLAIPAESLYSPSGHPVHVMPDSDRTDTDTEQDVASGTHRQPGPDPVPFGASVTHHEAAIIAARIAGARGPAPVACPVGGTSAPGAKALNTTDTIDTSDNDDEAAIVAADGASMSEVTGLGMSAFPPAGATAPYTAEMPEVQSLAVSDQPGVARALGSVASTPSIVLDAFTPAAPGLDAASVDDEQEVLIAEWPAPRTAPAAGAGRAIRSAWRVQGEAGRQSDRGRSDRPRGSGSGRARGARRERVRSGRR